MKTLALVTVLLGLLGLARHVGAADHEDPLPFKRFVLGNGLTVVVSEDHKAPVIGITLSYHVGSKDEMPGKTGLAHIFEHMMFLGSAHHKENYTQALEPLGASGVNGSTDEDRTLYVQTVPRSALDAVLFLESDRMKSLLIDQDRLDAARAVIRNERALADANVYVRAWGFITPNTWPQGHPYAHAASGSVEDLNTVTVDDAKRWFERYYTPNNAVLTLAGDVDPATIEAQVRKYFGEIPPGPPLARQTEWIAERPHATHRMIVQDRGSMAILYEVWNVPGWASADTALLRLASGVLVLGETGRLYERLVQQDRIATRVTAGVIPREISSQLFVAVTAKSAKDMDPIRRAVKDEIARLLSEGPSSAELDLVKANLLAGFVFQNQQMGGFLGRATTLTEGQVYVGEPGFYKATNDRIKDATTEAVRRAAATWLTDRAFELEVQPFPAYRAEPAALDRSRLPEPSPFPEPTFPVISTFTLKNGLRVRLAERHSLPIIDVTLMIDSGFAADDPVHFGRASLLMAMLNQGTTAPHPSNALEVSRNIASLGALLECESGLDINMVSLATMKSSLPRALTVFADVILHPAFEEDEFVRVRQERLKAIENERANPLQAANRILPRVLYGEGHPYAQPLSGLGTAISVAKLTVADLKEAHRLWFHPDSATLVVIGDITEDELRHLLEKDLGDWKRGDPTPPKKEPSLIEPERNVVYLLDQPGTPQSFILAATLAPPRAYPGEEARQVMSNVLSSRLNTKLREENHWTYGAGAFFRGARYQRPLIINTAVQPDKTAESVREILSQIRGMAGEQPITSAEMEVAVNGQIRTLPGIWETSEAVSRSLEGIVRYGLPDNYYQGLGGRIRKVTLDEARDAAKTLLRPEHLVWVIVGDRKKISESLTKFDLHLDIRAVDADGNLLP